MESDFGFCLVALGVSLSIVIGSGVSSTSIGLSLSAVDLSLHKCIFGGGCLDSTPCSVIFTVRILSDVMLDFVGGRILAMK